MVIIIDSLPNQQVEMLQGQLVTIHPDAFSTSPHCMKWAEVVDSAQSLPQHMEKEGFCIAVALEDWTEQVIGFAYGCANTPDQFGMRR